MGKLAYIEEKKTVKNLIQGNEAGIIVSKSEQMTNSWVLRADKKIFA
jgi:hypothetical protein